MRPRLWLILLPIAIHWAALSGWLSADPLYLESGLTRDWQPNGVLPGLPGWIDGNSGITLEALGRLVAHDWKAGIIPWWNPYTGVGLPLAGEMQPAAFFLPFVLLLGITGGVLYLKITLMIIAGLSMWGLLRMLSLAPAPALLGAILFQLNGTFAWDADSSSLPVAFLPLFLLAIERARLCAHGGWRLIAVAVAYSVLSGFPETAFANGLLAFVWAALRFFQAGNRRWRFAGRVAGGGLVGLALCAPLLLAFLSLLGQSDLALRDLGHAALLPANFAMFLYPYLYGPIFFNQLFDIWYRLGGYVGLPVFLLALAALFATLERRAPKERALRWVLAGWMLLTLAKAGGAPMVTPAFNLVPLVAQSLFFRYAATSWECAAIVLAAFALDDFLIADAATRRRRILQASACCIAVTLAALAAGRPVWRDLGSVPGGRIWFYVALLWGNACAAGIALAWLCRKPYRHALFAVLALDTVIQFSIPLLAGTRGEARQMDLEPIGFLKQNVGLNRIYTLGPLPPNYGAFYGIAQINHDYAPVSAAWVSYVQKNLDPLANPIQFNGFSPPPEDGMETRPEALRRRLPAYERVGVKYVLSTPFLHPFALAPVRMHKATQVIPLTLKTGEAAHGSIGPGEYDTGNVDGAGVNIATFRQIVAGQLSLKLCAGTDCASGSATLGPDPDNAYVWFTLDHALSFGDADRINFELRHTNGDAPIALWAWRGAAVPDATIASPNVKQTSLMPELLLLPSRNPHTPHLVFQGRRADIYELPDAAPYFVATGCRLSDEARESVRAHCNTASHLLRRELFFPGWHAQLNGADVPITTDTIFQGIELPAGESVVRFRFAPPHIVWGYAAAVLGAVALGFAGRKGFFFEKKKQKTFMS
jgi:hypothetical protein